ncbi:MAG TPA: amino acid deaminase [Caulobacteraceae bacterium]|jgi:D-serine dehydratase|nr:amino acid deaminase [Caulobacteraceae bacterium]
MGGTDAILDGRTKGLPHGSGGLRLSDIGDQGWRLLAEDLPLPVAVLRASAMANNSRWMRAFLASSGAKLAPHGKTTMSPDLFAMQIADGAWGLTVATAQQMRVARQAGVQRILVANEFVGAQDIAYVLGELRTDPRLEVYCLADSLEGVRRLAAAAAAQPAGRPIGVLVELGAVGGRTGCRNPETALAVARAVSLAAPHLSLAGVEGYEGLNQGLPGGEGAFKAASLLDAVAGAAEAMDAEALFAGDEVIVSAGGSAYYDLVVERLAGLALSKPVALVLRSGCYLTHDAGLYERLFGDVRERSQRARDVPGGFQNALEVWAHVLSVPEPRRAILAAGRRDFGHDAGAPTPLKQYRPGRDEAPRDIAGAWEIVAINDQHAHMVFPDGVDIAVGDLVALGVSHPCTTFDRWRLIYLVDNDYAVTSAIQTFF